MAVSFTGNQLVPSKGGNPLGRKLEGVRVSALKKGQNSITLGEDVLEALGVTIPEGGVAVSITEGSGIHAGKLLLNFGEGPFKLRYSNSKRKTTGVILSSAIPVKVSGKAPYKPHPDDKALVIKLPTEAEAPAPAAAAEPAAAPAADPAPAADADLV